MGLSRKRGLAGSPLGGREQRMGGLGGFDATLGDGEILGIDFNSDKVETELYGRYSGGT